MGVLKFEERLNHIVLFAGNNMVSDHVLAFLTEDLKNGILYVYREYEWDTMTVEQINLLQPDVIVTCYWPYLLSKEMIATSKYGCINFHPALLPNNRGWYPSVWEVLEKENAGVTLHLIDEGADTGPIIAQEEIEIEETDTGGSVYKKSQEAMISLFKKTWVQLYEGIELKEQDHSKATYHSKKDGNDCNGIDVDQMYNAGYLIDLLKAKTFGSKSYAYYEKNGKKYFVRVDITESNE